MGREILQLIRDIRGIPFLTGRSIHNASRRIPRRLCGSRPMHKNLVDLSPRAGQHKYKSLAAPCDPCVKVLEIVYSDDCTGFATSPQDMAHMYNTFSHGCWSTGGSSQCKKIKMCRAEPKNGTLDYVDGEVETMQDMFTLQKSDLKMIGIPLIPREIPKEPTLKFAKCLSILQGISHVCNPPLYSDCAS